MEGLYNKVIKGQISKIPERFSSDIWEIVKMLIQVSPAFSFDSWIHLPELS